MKNKLFVLLIPVFFFFACRTVRPPVRPVAGLYPTVDISYKLDKLTALSCDEEQLREALISIRVWDLLLQAGMEETELSLVKRGLAEHGYAEIDARRSAAPIHWVSFVSEDGARLKISAAFMQPPPPHSRQQIMLEKTPNRHEGRKVERNQRPEYQYINVWQCPMKEGNPLEIWKISGQNAHKPNNTHWEIHRSFDLE